MSNKPAFPCAYRYDPEYGRKLAGVSGITFREYAAVAAMQGILGSEVSVNEIPESVASEAVSMADALIAELAKEGK